MHLNLKNLKRLNLAKQQLQVIISIQKKCIIILLLILLTYFHQGQTFKRFLNLCKHNRLKKMKKKLRKTLKQSSQDQTLSTYIQRNMQNIPLILSNKDFLSRAKEKEKKKVSTFQKKLTFSSVLNMQMEEKFKVISFSLKAFVLTLILIIAKC